MKKICLIIMAFTFAITSCSKWLEVEPKTEIKSDIMFESETGFKDALIGIYLILAERSLYGRELTVGFIDAIGQQYDMPTNAQNIYSYSRSFNFTHATVTPVINSAWNQFYYAIANLNNLLYYIDLNKNKIHPTHYAIIKGEAIGLRAFLHFDLLRIFGWENLEKNTENLDLLSIPYVYDYDKSITKQSTTKEVLANIHKDLEIAEDLLNNYDSWGIATKDDDYVLPNEDKFYTNRSKRFNYWAVVATQARVYMWEGKRDKALEYANNFIDNYSTTTIKWISDFNINGDEFDRDWTFSTEHIFSLNANKQYDNFKDVIDPQYNKPNANPNLIYHTSKRARSLFRIDENMGVSDYRYNRLYDRSNENYTFLKYHEKEDYKYVNIMPMIRMSEMYLTAAECLNYKGDANSKKIAIEHMNLIRKNRGISSTFNILEDVTSVQLSKEIENEWLKEFISEGQIFYFFKRLGYDKIPNSTITPKYRIPLPNDEVNIAGRENYNKK